MLSRKHIYVVLFLLFSGREIVYAETPCSDVYQLYHFKDRTEDQFARTILDLFDAYNKVSSEKRPIIHDQIYAVYRRWLSYHRDRIGGFPVRPLKMMQKYFGEPIWLETPETIKLRGERVPYLSQTRRSQLEVEMTESGVIHSKTGKPIEGLLNGDIVISMDLKVYILDSKTRPVRGVYKHSSILMSAPVLFAGTISLTPSGQVLLLNNQSGHYRPGKQNLRWAKDFLTEQGFEFSN